MKAVKLSLVLLVLMAPSLFAADVEDKEFPSVSKFQMRQPAPVRSGLDVGTLDHDACGPNPSIPSNCIYACNNGVPIHDGAGNPVLICWYEPDPGGGGCTVGSTCEYTGWCGYASIWQGCSHQYYSCSNCNP